MRAVLCGGNKVYLMNYINAKHTKSLGHIQDNALYDFAQKA